MNTSVGIALVGHGDTASHLLRAARAILGPTALADVVAVDAGAGVSDALEPLMCDAISQVDEGRGVVVMVDLFGASPCQCAERHRHGHGVTMLSGLNLAMILKLAAIDRSQLTAEQVADACADSGRRSVQRRSPSSSTPQDP
jgi:PTS system mannose-specific IIA component